MAVGTYRGIDGVARKLKKEHRGVNNVARNIKAEWRGVGGIARLTFRGNVLFDGGSGDFVAESGNYTKTRIESDKAVIYADNNISGSDSMKFEHTGVKSVKPVSLNGYSKIRVTFCGDSRTIYPAQHYVFVAIVDNSNFLNGTRQWIIDYNYVDGVYHWSNWVDFTRELDISTYTGEWYVQAGMYTGTMMNDGDVMYIKKIELIE